MKIHFLKEDALVALKTNVPANLAKYKLPTNEWIYDYFQGEDPFMEAAFECEDFQLVTGTGNETASQIDVQNTRILYSALRGLTDTQATDGRLWAGLCHYDFWEFLNKRWKIEQGNRLITQLITGRYFLSSATGKKRSLTINSLSKLWWLGRWTYDPHRADPYELLKYFETEFSTKILFIFSNNYMNNTEIAYGMMEALVYLESIGYERKGTEDLRHKGARLIFQEAMGFLNLYGGTHILDFFTKEEIKNKVLEHMLSLPHTSTEGISSQVFAVGDVGEKPSPPEKAKPLERKQEEKPAKPSAQQVEPVKSRRTAKKQYDGERISETDKALLSYCREMQMPYSYKALLLLALLNHLEEDGKMQIEDAVPFFRGFYRMRIRDGLPPELKPSIYSDLAVTDASILTNIIRNPLNAFLLTPYFEYDEGAGRFGFKREIWPDITKQGCKELMEAAKRRIAGYYRDDRKHGTMQDAPSAPAAARSLSAIPISPRDYVGKRVFHTSQKVYATVVDYDRKYFTLRIESGEKKGQSLQYNAAVCLRNNWLEIVE